MPPAQPLTPAKKEESDKEKTPVASSSTPGEAKSGPIGTIAPNDISSPHELTAFVETLLTQLDSKFDEMSDQILERMTQMSTRVDALEAAIQDIINGDVTVPQSPGMGQ
ncbi:hypothetical protein AX16_007518 [Volvariella volvacea WC 439]|nr:hypothetical protein AX16_007518 [Volvariella volvacea WC 439]